MKEEGPRQKLVGDRQRCENFICLAWFRSVCGAHSAHVTGVAEEMGVQREALRARLIRELLTALLKGGETRERDEAPGMLIEEESYRDTSE